MYNISENIRIVIAVLKAHNINQLVLNPGGTNAGFIRGVQDDSFFNCYSIVDERSAVYFAIGLYLSTKKPIAVCCTSAQATRNYIPGLTEAFYKRVPILAITFSKHPQYTYQEYMQAPDQTSLPADSVKKSFPLPFVSNDHDRVMCERMVNEAVLEITHRRFGPVQLNVPMLDSQLSIDTVKSLPHVKVINRYTSVKSLITLLSNKKVLIVVGENSGLSDRQLDSLVTSLNAIIYTNHLSNYNGQYVVNGNLLLESINQIYFDEILSPDILITFGGQTGDYPLYHKLSDSKNAFSHWRVDVEGEIIDTYNHLTAIFEESAISFIKEACTVPITDHTYYFTWQSNIEKLKRDVEIPLSNIYIAQQLSSHIPKGSIVNFAILNSLRSWNFFDFANKVNCNSNVAAFGIDGCMSTFIGQSINSDLLGFHITGDLAFLYDLNSLSIKYIKNNIRIILINNNGGVEFKLWGNTERDRVTDRFIAAANHFNNAKGWAETCGFKYYRITTKEDFLKQKNILLSKSERPIIFEIFTRDEDERRAFTEIISINRELFLKGIDNIKWKIKKIIKQ